ncbi:MAG: hypothetical protein KatS3mg001_498 [Candidatus Pacearchaeota archaeon]|nr:MAG: hypothetical protein KatS3mg001_498 [Candidatus Pacearchaeota archaeon]
MKRARLVDIVDGKTYDLRVLVYKYGPILRVGRDFENNEIVLASSIQTQQIQEHSQKSLKRETNLYSVILGEEVPLEINPQAISRIHAILSYFPQSRDEGFFYIEDRSLNGTIVVREKRKEHLKKGEVFKLQDKDALWFSPYYGPVIYEENQ